MEEKMEELIDLAKDFLKDLDNLADRMGSCYFGEEKIDGGAMRDFTQEIEDLSKSFHESMETIIED